MDTVDVYLEVSFATKNFFIALLQFAGINFLNFKLVKYPIPAREPQIRYPNPLDKNYKYPNLLDTRKISKRATRTRSIPEDLLPDTSLLYDNVGNILTYQKILNVYNLHYMLISTYLYVELIFVLSLYLTPLRAPSSYVYEQLVS